ncbi:MAG: 30S ribosomal protein S9 [Candidatus Wolfebacteria bacterium]|nr:30S ribosomal protein S9 [Candidatus Wolfebacteria bacterium]
MAEKTVKIVKTRKPKEPKEAPPAKERYFEAVGRRKLAVARVRLYPKQSKIEINGRTLTDYFPTMGLQRKITESIDKLKIEEKLGMTVKVMGGGQTGQAEAIRLGVSRALVKMDEEMRKRLRRFNLLTRDSRKVERKKFGLKKARRAPQWKKR